jgi:hypothetical protein
MLLFAIQTQFQQNASQCQFVNFFEDHTAGQDLNRNSWSVLELARYILEEKDALDSAWLTHAEQLTNFAMSILGYPAPGNTTLIGEQVSLAPGDGCIAELLKGGVGGFFYLIQQHYLRLTTVLRMKIEKHGEELILGLEVLQHSLAVQGAPRTSHSLPETIWHG